MPSDDAVNDNRKNMPNFVIIKWYKIGYRHIKALTENDLVVYM